MYSFFLKDDSSLGQPLHYVKVRIRIKVTAVVYPLTRVKTFSKSSSNTLSQQPQNLHSLTKRQLCRLPHEFYIRISTTLSFGVSSYGRLSYSKLGQGIQFYGWKSFIVGSNIQKEYNLSVSKNLSCEIYPSFIVRHLGYFSPARYIMFFFHAFRIFV